MGTSRNDGGAAGGNSNLTKERRPVDDTSANDRVTGYSYDFRDRRIETESGSLLAENGLARQLSDG